MDPLQEAMLMHRISASLAVSLALLGSSTGLLCQTQVIPAAYTAAEAASSASAPWNTLAVPTRVQYCYDSSYFTAAGITGPVVLTGMRFRANAAAVTSTWTGGVFSNAQIDLSTCGTNFAAITPTFDLNHGSDRTNVLAGTVTVQPGAGAGAGLPGAWYITILFDAPFVYDPTLGDLLTEYRVSGWSGTSSFSCDHDFAAATVQGSRLLSNVSTTNATGTVAQGHAPVVEFTYAAVAGLFPSFTATPIRGASPLLVQFTDRSVTSSVFGVLSWQWDFDNNGTVDSTAQNPTFSYGCGTHSVRLTVSDGINPAGSLLRAGLVVTDEIVPGFTFVVTAPGIVQFTDTTTPPATSWAWDFDSNASVDSTVQNPAFNYGSSGLIPLATLTASRLCGPSTAVSKPVYTSLSLDIPGIANVGSLASPPFGAGYWFNMTVTEPSGITLKGLVVSAGGNTTGTLNLYASNLGWSGRTGSSAGWHLNQTGAATKVGSFFYSMFTQPKHYGPGTYGMYIHLLGGIPTSGTIVAGYGNADFTVNPGAVQVGGTPFAGGALATRMHPGAFLYTKGSFDGVASNGWTGSGCPGSLGVSAATPVGNPIVGQSYSIDFSNCPANVGLVAWGLSRTTSGLGALPVDLTGLGYTGCNLRVSTDIDIQVAFTGSTTLTWGVAIPNDPFFIGIAFYNQVLMFEPGFNAGGGVLSDATSSLMGN